MGDGDDVTGELPQHPELLHQLRGLLHHVLRVQAGAQELSHPRQGQTWTREWKCSMFLSPNSKAKVSVEPW